MQENPFKNKKADLTPFDTAHAETMRKINEAYGYIPNKLNIAATGAGSVAGVTNTGRVTAAELAPVLAEAARSRSASESSYNQQRAMMDTAYKQQIKQASAEWEAANAVSPLDVISGIAGMAVPGIGLFNQINKFFKSDSPAVSNRAGILGTYQATPGGDNSGGLDNIVPPTTTEEIIGQPQTGTQDILNTNVNLGTSNRLDIFKPKNNYQSLYDDFGYKSEPFNLFGRKKKNQGAFGTW